MSRLFASGLQSTLASASVLPMNIHGRFALDLTGLISLLFKGLWGLSNSDIRWFIPVVFKVCSQDLQQQHHLGTCKKCKFSGSTPDLLHQKFKGGAQSSVFEQTFQGITTFPGINRCFTSQVYHLEAVWSQTSTSLNRFSLWKMGIKTNLTSKIVVKRKWENTHSKMPNKEAWQAAVHGVAESDRT